MNYGIRFKRYRVRKGFTQTEAAKLIGVKNYQLGNYETGRSEPSIDILKKMSNLYGVSIDLMVANIHCKVDDEVIYDDKRAEIDEILNDLNTMVKKINDSKD